MDRGEDSLLYKHYYNKENLKSKNLLHFHLVKAIQLNLLPFYLSNIYKLKLLYPYL